VDPEEIVFGRAYRLEYGYVFRDMRMYRAQPITALVVSFQIMPVKNFTGDN